ncbi:MAG: HPr family phosphocarrier protein [Desulfobacterales bacterium]
MNAECRKEVEVVNELGFHARTAAQIAKLAQKATSKIWIIKDDEKVEASSIIDILTLACGKGCRVTFVIENQSDADILKDIVALVENGFGEYEHQ